MARGDMLQEMAASKLRRILDRNQTHESADSAVGDSPIVCGQISRKSSPTWRGPAIISDID